MSLEEEHKHFKWCEANKIRVYPVPISTHSIGEYHLVVERDRIPSRGKVIFRNQPKKGEVSVWDQTRVLLKMIYEKENINQ